MFIPIIVNEDMKEKLIFLDLGFEENIVDNRSFCCDVNISFGIHYASFVLHYHSVVTVVTIY